MADRYTQMVNTSIGRQLTSLLGLPRPVELRRHTPGDPLLPGPALVTGPVPGRMATPVIELLEREGVPVHIGTPSEQGDTRYAAVILDATSVATAEDLGLLHATFHPTVARLEPSARVLVIGAEPSDDPAQAAAQRALEGFVRSLAKELRAGATANLLRVVDGAEEAATSTLRFLLSGRSAYVTGQPIVLTGTHAAEHRPERPLTGQVAVVTGAARGIGAAIAGTLARDGAEVVCLDLPAQGQELTAVANRVGGTTLQLDITAEDAPERLAAYLTERHDGVDVVVHNAGITRDKTIVGMDRDRWDLVLTINLAAQERIDDHLLAEDVLRAGGRIVTVSSVSGIAGNRGQTNYATSKAGLIGRVEAMAPVLAERDGSINAVAPGFIETEMTGAMPFAVREVGRRMNSLNQGGLPVDVAEAIAWLADPASTGVNGQVVRVCGQSLIGA